MSLKVSPLAPHSYPDMPPMAGVSLGAIEAGIKYKGRKDLAVIRFSEAASVAGVFTRSKCPSAPVDWCRKHLQRGKASVVVINSGNANAFTGKKGAEAVAISVDAASHVFNCAPESVFLASTGVIGEPLNAEGFREHLARLNPMLSEGGWADVARAIMTTDTYPKMATHSFQIAGKRFSINGIAKGSGMIQPDLGTMLAFVATDFPADHTELQTCLSEAVEPSFNSITVDSDTSTSDTVLLFSAPEPASSVGSLPDNALDMFRAALSDVMLELAMLTVRDGEGASKLIEVTVSGAEDDQSAKRIAFSIANSPLIKTAIAGEDANWGRVVMAVGKAGEPADRDRLNIYFGDVRVAFAGERDPEYSEAAASSIVKRQEVPIRVELGLGDGHARVWTCDLTHDYIAINADYRS
jgi:glutamate N-acetyltransferase/amino-acid N-acetyltransferase